MNFCDEVCQGDGNCSASVCPHKEQDKVKLKKRKKKLRLAKL